MMEVLHRRSANEVGPSLTLHMTENEQTYGGGDILQRSRQLSTQIQPDERHYVLPTRGSLLSTPAYVMLP